MSEIYFNTELVFDMFYVHDYLSDSKLYDFSNERYICLKEKSKISKKHYSKKIKTFWENIISRAFITNMSVFIKEEENIDKLLESAIECMKENILEYDNFFCDNDPHFCNINKNHMFYYLTGKKCKDYLMELLSDEKFIGECKKVILYMLEDNISKIISCFQNIYPIIHDHNVGFKKFYNEKNMFLSYLIPKIISINKNIYTLFSMIGIGSYGCVCKYVNNKESICLKIYFKENKDSEILKIIDNNDELKNIIIDSFYLDTYSLGIKNEIIGLEEYDSNKLRNIHYLIMECGEHIDTNFINKNKSINKVINIMCDIIEKIYILLKFGIYFTDIKISNMVLNRNGELRFIDLDSFYFLGKNRGPIFSYMDIVSDLIPIENKKINITSDNIFILEKIMIRKLALIFMEFIGFDVYKIKRDEFTDIWSRYVYEHISTYRISIDEVIIIQNMLTYNMKNIPNLENVYNIFLKLKN
jgi:hypothetical protein